MAASRRESICKEIHDSLVEHKERVAMKLLLCLTQEECRKSREHYVKVYGEDLVEVLQRLDPAAARVTVQVLLSPFQRDAAFAREAISNTDYRALVEIFATRKSSHVVLISQAYAAKYRSHLELDIAAIEPHHPYQKMLMALSASHKAHRADISHHIAKCDAKRLYETGEGKRPLGAIDEAVVLEIFSKRTISQLRLALSCYNHIYGHTYTHFLKNEVLGGEFEDVVRVVAKCIYSPSTYYAKVMYECLKGTMINKRAIERILVSRAEVDMDEIQKIFKRKYRNELKNVICECITQGDYRDLLVAIGTK